MASKQWIVVYLDTDSNGDDLLDSVGNPIPAGWYRYSWPLQPEPDGPFETELEAGFIIHPEETGEQNGNK